VSIGGEIVTMSNGDELRDRNVLLTGNIVYDLVTDGSRRVTPFVVAGGGIFWGRDQVVTGPYWSSDPAFTAGGGLRLRLNEALSAAAEYRIGWELHQRISATAGLHW
jgi:hypothetical protein